MATAVLDAPGTSEAVSVKTWSNCTEADHRSAEFTDRSNHAFGVDQPIDERPSVKQVDPVAMRT